VTYEFKYNRGYPPVVNHKEDTEFVAGLAPAVPGVANVYEIEPSMGGEDFGYYMQKVPGTFFFTGVQNPDWDVTYPHHHPKFDIDERGLLVAANVLGTAALSYLKKEAGKKVEAV
jgi:metal-dependent amidase/aminoacylase/carboxypeptidase family protein